MPKVSILANDKNNSFKPKISKIIILLLAVNIFSYVDRSLPTILAHSIKRELSLSDTQVGLLSGLAFSAIYALVSLPLARLADRWSAKGVLAICLAFWSLLTSLGGLAQNFWQLSATRSGVAAGEAGGMPAAHVLISAHYPTHLRATMISVFSLGAAIGSMGGLILGAQLAELYGWRFAMIIMGVPGLALAAFVALFVKHIPPARSEDPNATFMGTVRFLLGKPSYRHMLFAVVTSTACGLGFSAFNPMFLMRIHHLSMSQVGMTMGLIGGTIASVGILLGGILADRVGRRAPEWTLWIPGLAHIIAAPFVMATYFVPSIWFVIPLLMVPAFFGPMSLTTFAAAQQLAPPHMRAMASAVLMLGMNFVGGSIGPLLVGTVSDLLTPMVGQDALRYALGGLGLLYLWAGFHFFRAGKLFAGDLDPPAD